MDVSKRIHLSRLMSLVAFAAVAVVVASAQTQRRSSTALPDPVTADLRCRVLLPSGVAAGRGIKVTLNTSVSPVNTLYSDRNGETTFRYLRAGEYRVVVEADAARYEPVTEEATVMPGREAIVSIYLRERSIRDPKPVGGLASLEEFDGTVPPLAKKEYDRATKLVKKGETEGAIRGFERAIAIYADYQKARNDLGVQYFRAGRTREAAEQFETVIRLNPKAFKPRLNLGLLLVDTGDHARGIEELRRAIAIDDTNPAAHLNLGIALTEIGELDVARKELHIALLLGQDTCIVANYYLGLGHARRQERDEAVQCFNTYLAQAPKGEFAAAAKRLVDELSAAK